MMRYEQFLNLQYFPEEGITVFANLLHTHTIGKDVTV